MPEKSRAQRGPVWWVRVTGPWQITSTGITGDAQGDLLYHGGPEKALHHYPQDHYSTWNAEIGDHPLLSVPGAFGENLATSGWTEHDVCIGDVARFGSAILQVSHASSSIDASGDPAWRSPCRERGARVGTGGC